MKNKDYIILDGINESKSIIRIQDIKSVSENDGSVSKFTTTVNTVNGNYFSTNSVEGIMKKINDSQKEFPVNVVLFLIGCVLAFSVGVLVGFNIKF